MYICLDCAHVFDEPVMIINHAEEHVGCPSCGGMFASAFKCEECDNVITGDYVKTKSNQRFCEDCYHSYNLGDE